KRGNFLVVLCRRWLNFPSELPNLGGHHYGRHGHTVGNPISFVINATMGYVVIFLLAALPSFVSHKEFRFLLPAFPLAMVVCGAGMARLPRLWALGLATVLAVSFFPPAVYLGVYHQKGALEVVDFLGTELEANPKANVLFLMPCHSTPYYSHIHRRVKMRFLKCEPNIHRRRNHVDEAKEFFLNPTGAVETIMMNGMPTYIVFYNNIYKHMLNFVVDHDYNYLKGFTHTHFPTTTVGKEIWVYKHL
ncbi:unnamed protein product, partial [Ixodes pacificus]